jgi:AraC-like DNA-binding protein
MCLDGKKYIVPENHLIFVRPNQLHECRCSATSSIMCVVFSNDFVPFFNSLLKEKTFENPIFDFSDNTDLISELDSTSSNKTLKICGLLNIILDKMLEKSPLISKDKVTPNTGIFHLIINYISRNFTDDIYLSDVARDLGYHEKYLSSTVRSLTGVNFRTFLAMYRINYAKNLITNYLKLNHRVGSISTTKLGFFVRFCTINPMLFFNKNRNNEIAGEHACSPAMMAVFGPFQAFDFG